MSQYVERIEVIVTNEEDGKPDNVIKVFNGDGQPSSTTPNINHSFGGRYIWVVPIYTSDPDRATYGFSTVISSSSLSDGSVDLAVGAGGDYRYLKPVHIQSPEFPKRVGEVALIRTFTEIQPPLPHHHHLVDEAAEMLIGFFGKDHKFHFNGLTKNVNKGRGDEFVYLAWRWA